MQYVFSCTIKYIEMNLYVLLSTIKCYDISKSFFWFYNYIWWDPKRFTHFHGIFWYKSMFHYVTIHWPKEMFMWSPRRKTCYVCMWTILGLKLSINTCWNISEVLACIDDMQASLVHNTQQLDEAHVKASLSQPSKKWPRAQSPHSEAETL